MWEHFTRQVAALRSLDRTFSAFGAEFHRYQRNETLTERVIANVERDNQIALPEQLKKFYLEFGNGTAGCDYGIFRLAQLRGFRPLGRYVPVSELTVAADVDEDGYFEVSHGRLSGLLIFEEQGCGHVACVIASGARANEVVFVSNDGYVEESGVTMLEYFERVYDERLAIFSTLRDLMMTRMTLEEIESAMRERFSPPGAAKYVAFSTPDYIASLAGVEKPEAIFGTRTNRIYHGAQQNRWYRQVLSNWRIERAV